jgi:hypothetical protein
MKKLLLVAAVIVMASASQGERTAHAQVYGTAGCGLGSVIIGNKPGIVQIFAATTNGTFANQTFGITSGTLNCGGGPGTVQTAKQFIETNREAFAKDVSRGSGETIDNLVALAGCSDPKTVGATLQANFRAIFPSAGVKDTTVSANAVSVLQSDRALQCSKLI